MVSVVDWKLAELLSWKSCDQHHEVQLDASHWWCTQGSILAPVLFNIFINDLEAGIECKLADDTKLRRVVDTPNGCGAIQGDLNRLKIWADRNLMKFKTGKSQVLHLGGNKPMHQYVLGADQLESSLAEKDLEVLLNTNLDMSQKSALVIRRQQPPGLH